jgi:ribonucleoside-diphosphate reductase beta chain
MTVALPTKIFNLEKSDYGNMSIILGEDPGLLDSVNNNHPELYDLYKTLRNLDWDEQEFDFSTCLTEFKTCEPTYYDMMVKTLAWQWEADSVASRSIVNVLSNVVTDSRVWAGYVRINDNEDVHALTYSEIVRNSFDDPSEIMGEILAVEQAHSRMACVARVMGKAHETSHKYALGQVENNQETYNDIFMFLVALYFLERIQFMASFAITFALGKLGLFQPICMAVQKIMQDEFEIHAQFGQGVLKAELRTERGRLAYEQCFPQMQELFWEILKSEITWAGYLFSEGRELTGVTKNKLIQWIMFNGRAAGGFLGLNETFLENNGEEFFEMTGMELTLPEVNPLGYMNKYIDISDTQVSNQEQDGNQYKVNILDMLNEEEKFTFELQL